MVMLWPEGNRSDAFSVRYFDNVGLRIRNSTYKERTGDENPFRGVRIHSKNFIRIAVVDWDGHGRAELVVYGYCRHNCTHSVQFWSLGQSGRYEQQFGSANPFGDIQVQIFEDLQFVDWNGDGHPDVLGCSIHQDFGGFRYFESQANGSLVHVDDRNSSFPGIVEFMAQHIRGWALLRAVDWDGDGDFDLVAQVRKRLGGREIKYFERLHDKSLVLRSAGEDPFRGYTGDISDLRFVDFTGSGLPDLVRLDGNSVHSIFSRTFSTTLSEIAQLDYRAPSFSPQIRSIFSAQQNRWDLGDLDGDGDADLVVTFSDRSGLMYFENIGGSFVSREGRSNPFDHVYEEAGCRRTHCKLGCPRILDWDNDGSADLIVSVRNYYMGTNSSVHLFKNVGGAFQYNGSLVSVLNERPTPGVSTYFVPDALVVVDVDGDGISDLISCTRYYRRRSDGIRFEEVTGADNPIASALSQWSACVTSASRGAGGRLDVVVHLWDDRQVKVMSRIGSGPLVDLASDDGPLVGANAKLIRRSAGAGNLETLCRDHWPKFFDVDGDGENEVVAFDFADRPSALHFRAWRIGTCWRQEACNGHGFCQTTTQQCTCLATHGGPDCSMCSPAHWTDATDFESLMRGRTCQACPGAQHSPDGACSKRGTCQDDERARLATGSPLAVGSGSCDCSSAAFHGQSCADGACQPGFYETVILNSSLHVCSACPGGRFSKSNGSAECDACPQGWYSDDGASACLSCFVGWSTAGPGAGGGRNACRIDAGAFILHTLLMAGLALLIPVLQLITPASARIDDVAVQGGGVVVKTCGPHRILRKPPFRSVRVWLRDTGHPNATLRQAPFFVEVVDSERVRLTEASSQPAHVEIESSMGVLRVHGPLGRGVLGVPAAFVFAGLLVGDFFLAAYLLTSVHADRRLKAGLVASVLVALGLLAGAVWVHVSKWAAAETPLSDSLKAFRKSLPATPVRNERGPTRAVAVQHILNLFDAFEAHIRNRNMYYVSENIVKALTKPHKVSYAEFVGPRALSWFVSHFWGMPFRQFVESVRLHAKDVDPNGWLTQAYCVCTLSNNQWAVESEVGNGDWRRSSFYLALRSESCLGTCMVLDERVEPLRRSWCLFETLQSIILRQERPQFKGFVFCTSSGVLNYGAQAYDVAISIAKEVSTIRVENAKASVQADKDMIDGLVMDYPGGFARVNKFLGENVKGALKATRASFEADFNSLSAVLGEESESNCEPASGPKESEVRQPQPPRVMEAAAGRRAGQCAGNGEDQVVDLESQIL